MPSVAIVSFEWDVVDLVESLGHTVCGFFDRVPQPNTFGFEYLGPDDAWPALHARQPDVRVALAIDSPSVKARLYRHYGADAIVALRSPQAYVSKRADVGAGAIIQRGVTIMPFARVGLACKINVNASLHHHVSLGDYCTVAPGALLLGNVRIGEGAYIGAGAIVRQQCAIGAGAFIGAGAVVVKDVPENATVVGVPAARRLR
jgi:acetyltransferase EpsM